MEKNAVVATVGLGAVGALLALYGFHTYSRGEEEEQHPPDPQQNAQGKELTPSPPEPSEGDTAHKSETEEKPVDDVVHAVTDKAVGASADAWSTFWKAEYDKQQDGSSDVEPKDAKWKGMSLAALYK